MMDIKTRVANLVKEHGTSDPYKLAASMGIRTYDMDLPVGIRGFYVIIKEHRFIAFNYILNASARRVVVAHELGHVALHEDYGHYLRPGQFDRRSVCGEAEANEFAARLLTLTSQVDEEEVLAQLRHYRNDPDKVHTYLRETFSNWDD